MLPSCFTDYGKFCRVNLHVPIRPPMLDNANLFSPNRRICGKAVGALHHVIARGAAKRRLLTGYAVTFNKRHHRWGHLFQNRYKSILCQEDAYLLEFTRYIHLNPLRAKLVAGIKELDGFRYCGHAVVMCGFKNDWQDGNYILKRFGKKVPMPGGNIDGLSKKGSKRENGRILSAGGCSEAPAGGRN